MGLWGTLKVASICAIDSVKVFGDSLVIINWANKQANLENTLLHHWCQRTSFMLNNFLDLSILHVYKENNDVADSLSKEVVDGERGALYWEEWVDGICAHFGSLNSFLS